MCRRDSTVETVLLYHVVPGATIMSGDALKANGARLKTAVPGKVIRVKVTSAPAIILGDYNTALANPRVNLDQVDINKVNKQVAHGITAVLMLIVSAILMFIACILMALELVAYRPWEASGIPNASRSIPASSSQVSLQRLT